VEKEDHMTTIEERLETLEQELTTLKAEQHSSTKRLDERINALQQQIAEHRLNRRMLIDNELQQVTIDQCSFCGKHRDQVERLIMGPSNTAICNECVESHRKHIEEGERDFKLTRKPLRACSSCGTCCPESYHYCNNCGSRLMLEA